MILSLKEQQKRINLIKDYNNEVSKYLGVQTKDININVTSTRKHSYGTYNKSTNVLSLSIYLINEDDVKNTILHELCHVYAPEGAHHGPKWKNLAKKIGKYFGTTINVRSNKERDSNALYAAAIAVLTCPKCGNKWFLYKKTKCFKTKAAGYKCRHCCMEVTFEMKGDKI